MCLTTNQKEPIEAKKDIIVYKHIIDNLDGTYETSFKYSPIVIGEEYESELGSPIQNEVGAGLHSFAEREDAERECDYWNGQSWGADEVVVKCIIPKGAEYYLGEFCGLASYASNKLKYVELI